MNQKYNLFEAKHREALALLLPHFRPPINEIPQSVFLESTSYFASCMDLADKLYYQFGSVFIEKNSQSIGGGFDLHRLVTIGTLLKKYKNIKGFNKTIINLNNIPQFHDTCFEIEVAHFLIENKFINNIEFEPDLSNVGFKKVPEFVANSNIGKVAVECKNAKPLMGKTAAKFRCKAKEFNMAMSSANWPEGVRLEVEINSSFQSSSEKIAHEVVRKALNNFKKGETRHFKHGPVKAYVLDSINEFILDDEGLVHLTLLPKIVTGIFNPKLTQLKILDRTADKPITSAVGRIINEAMRQLPENYFNLIAITGIPYRIIKEAFGRRLDSKEFKKILAIMHFRDGEFNLLHRNSEQSLLEDLFRELAQQ